MFFKFRSILLFLRKIASFDVVSEGSQLKKAFMRSDRRGRPNFLVRVLVGAGVVFCGLAVQARQSTPTVQPTVDEIKALEAEYEALAAACRKSILEVRQYEVRYFDSSRDESIEVRKEWEQLKAECQTQMDKLAEVATKLFDAQEKPSPELAELVARVQEKALRDGFPSEAFRLGKKMIAVYPDMKKSEMVTALAAIKINEFDFAKKYYDENNGAIEAIEPEYSKLFGSIENLVTQFERERQFREQDAKKELPLVTIETNRGVVKIELFEDQAPGTVANFISLVEQGFYDDLIFHWVLKSFAAETGVYTRRRTSSGVDVNYFIVDEFDREDVRHHFRGSLSLIKSEAANTGNERFVICLEPVPLLDGKRTVFGRVVEGMEVMDGITHTYQLSEEGEPEPIPEVHPDYIVKTTVTRKRADSEYKINKVPRVNPDDSQ